MDTSNSLNGSGLFVDNLHSLRIIDPKVSHDTVDLKDESRLYSGKLDDFREHVQQILNLTLKFQAEVDRQKLATIGAENLLKVTARKQEMQRQELQSLIQEKKNKLDQLTTEYQMLLRVEGQQREIIDHFYQE